jgi:hypothetical protein
MTNQSYTKEIISSVIVSLWVFVWVCLVNTGIVPRSAAMYVVVVSVFISSLYIPLGFFRTKKKITVGNVIQSIIIAFLSTGLVLFIFLSSTFKIS